MVIFIFPLNAHVTLDLLVDPLVPVDSNRLESKGNGSFYRNKAKNNILWICFFLLIDFYLFHPVGINRKIMIQREKAENM